VRTQWLVGTGALESAYFLRHGSMRLFSEQQLVDCAQGFDNHGCNGGLPSQGKRSFDRIVGTSHAPPLSCIY
jgi:hypothetical protein